MQEGIWRRAAGLLLVMTLLCGVGYTLVVTVVSQVLFPAQANGSVVQSHGNVYGSALLGQPFQDPAHLQGRIMQVDTDTFRDSQGHALLYAGPSNQSPASPQYKERVAQRVRVVQAENPAAGAEVPEELVTGSGSGLDPEISPAAAQYQIPRIAAASGRSEAEVRSIIERYTTGRFLGVFGEPRVNVLKVNLALDGVLQR